jgi:hypothetical protein
MAYRIVCISPIYCQITDGLIGSQAKDVEGYVYETEALAAKIAGRLSRDVERWGEEYYRALPIGVSAFDPYRHIAADPAFDDDEMPF